MKIYPSSPFPPVSAPVRKGSVDALFASDAAFDWMYPEHLQLLSLKHWTSLAVAWKAAAFLAEPGTRVLDIGSGVGKFCLAAAYQHPETTFCGVEQRPELVDVAERARSYLQLPNARFTAANMTQVNFNAFDHFYFYNAFYENIDPDGRIDETLELTESLYNYYTQYLYHTLEERPAGTRLVTFHTFGEEVPPDYRVVDISRDTLLKMWIKA